MERKNYFEILKIPFDPPDPPQVIKKKLSEWKREKEEQKNNSGNQSEINKLLSMYDDMENVLLTPASRQKEAAEIKEVRVQQLHQLLKIMLSGTGKTSTPEVTTAQMRNVGNHLGLQLETVKNVYLENGYQIQTPSTSVRMNDYFLQPTIFNGIEEYIVKLKNTETPKYPWTSSVGDLFDLLCFFDGRGINERHLYRNKFTDELCKLAKTFSVETATDTSSLGHIFGQLFSKATTQVFNNEKNRKKYENSLEKAKHKDFFDLLLSAPDVFKKDPYFAESAISKIQTFFPDRELALAVYNSETKSMNDPYEPTEAYVYVTCPYCKTISKFKTREEAQNAQCPVCSSSLYINCPNPKCHKKIPATSEQCSCGFSIIEYKYYNDYCNFARQAVKAMDFQEAERQLLNARRANPYANDLVSLENLISSQRKQYEKPISELQNLIDRQCYFEARRKIDSIQSTTPDLNLSGQRKMIESKIAEAEKMMPHAVTDQRVKANQCINVTNIVKDYQPAIEIIRSVPPLPPSALKATLKNSLTGTVGALSWQSSQDLGVTYTVIRKENVVPISPDDGTELVKDLSDTRFEDRTIQAGISYGYAVFACRYGTYSSSAATYTLETVMELDIRFFSADAQNGNCLLSWTLPTNCKGVRILRSEGGIPSFIPDSKSRIVCDKALRSFEDTGLSNNISYIYRLQCIYEFGGMLKYSSGILTDPIIPEEPPCILQNITAKFMNQTVTVSWQESRKKTDCIYIRKIKEDFDNSMIGKILPTKELNSMLDTKVLASAYSNNKKCNFRLNNGESVKIAVVSESGSNSIISDVCHISGVAPCEIDKEQTEVESNSLKVTLKSLPAGLSMIHYILTEKKDRLVWGTEEDVKNGRSCRVSLDEYKRNGNKLIIQKIPEKELCFTVIGEYNINDSKVYAPPSNIKINNKPKIEIRYNIIWNKLDLVINNMNKKDIVDLKNMLDQMNGPCLIIECDDNCLPELYLTCLKSGGLPWSFSDNDLQILYTFPERNLTGNSVTIPLTDFNQFNLQKGTVLRMMMSDEDMLEYIPVPMDVPHLKVP